jgi:hypothetical protein
VEWAVGLVALNLTNLHIEDYTVTMKTERRIEFAEAIAFSRAESARLIEIPLSKLNNWIDRNRLWQTDRGRGSHRNYTIREVFDLAGFALMRLAGIPEQLSASFVRNYGFYRKFLHDDVDGDQRASFSMTGGEWQVGVFNPNALLTLSINMRELAIDIFNRIAIELMENPEKWPEESFENFRCLYRKAVELDRLPSGSVYAFELDRKP